ncbi:uncharacterized protein KD926_004793 [Aspergillus affinis]|uniref:uncharacterized protein n=1 Tax=Aspergillus affinis TaxID=1070780 RepID=UPI0022FDC388|nr:uncharacterized protein KD926_004793 [Aspergillus affinis]KAI9043002.1 hypothetical protein KD926_004793 [Aspergillus affinis]
MQIETGATGSDDYKRFDSPDLWVRCRAAKEQLYAETDFSVKYRKTPPSLPSALPETLGAETYEPQEREPEKSSVELDLSVVASVKLPTVNPASWTVAVHNHHDCSPSSQQDPASENQNSEKPNSPSMPDSFSTLNPPSAPSSPAQNPPRKASVRVAHPSVALYIAPHLRDPSLQALRPQRNSTQRPYRPIPSRSESKQHQVTSDNQPTFFKSHLVTPLPNPSRLRGEVIHAPIPPQSSPLSSEVQKDTDLQEKKETEVKKMSDTGSDETMLARGNNFRGSKQEPPIQAESSRQAEERATHKSSKGRKPSNVQQEADSTPEQQENVPAGNAAGPSDDPDQPKWDSKEVLRRLQEGKGMEIIRNAHATRFKNQDCDTASPESLVSCRTGPGTDQKSEFYRIMARRRRAGKVATVIRKEKPSSSADLSFDAEEEKEDQKVAVDPVAAKEKHVAQWDAYLKSPHAYPVIEDGNMRLLGYPRAEHKRIEEQMSQTGIDQANAVVDKDMPRPDNKWADAYYLDWEYRPRACSSFEAFRDWFRRWLDSTTQICCYADIYHKSFFDGTAHPDGVQSMYIPNLHDEEVCFDTSDELTMLHAHETAEGYSHNFVLHSRKKAEEVQLRKEMNRKAYIEYMSTPPRENPNSPKANIFLRPARLEDSAGILNIMNWYAEHSTLSTDVRRIETGDVRQRIENCWENKLPFIVAVGRGTGPDRENQPEKTLGYALANDTIGRETSSRYTAELQVFVKDGHKRQGIGRCLMDKLLEVCDPTYIPKLGYFFNAKFDDQPKYHTGGCRRLACLIFAVGYQRDRRPQVQWLKDWLLEKYEFEEQAVLKRARVKFDHFNEVAYLIRDVAYSSNTKFEY